MFEPNICIDVSLLAMILGLHVTKNNRNLVLLLICVLFAHVLLTDDVQVVSGSNSDSVSDSDSDSDSKNDIVETEVQEAASADDSAVGAAPRAPQKPSVPPVTDSFATTLSSGVLSRQMSTPQTKRMSTVFPVTSVEANGKLASARTSFFESLVS